MQIRTTKYSIFLFLLKSTNDSYLIQQDVQNKYDLIIYSASAEIYVVQFRMCTSKSLNLYKVEQVGISVLHSILHVNLCPTWWSMCVMPHRIHVFTCLILFEFKCLLMHNAYRNLEGINVS